MSLKSSKTNVLLSSSCWSLLFIIYNKDKPMDTAYEFACEQSTLSLPGRIGYTLFELAGTSKKPGMLRRLNDHSETKCQAHGSVSFSC